MSMRHELKGMLAKIFAAGRGRWLLAAAVIVATGLMVYHPLLFPQDTAQKYPVGYDTWGHLIRAEYLYEEIRQGNFYPNLFPYWYNGFQLLRYHGLLPYYALAGLLQVTGDIFLAGGWYVFLTALLGGFGCLLFAKRLGLGLATAAGVLFMILPDQIGVGVVDGNLPRLLATSWLPYMLYFLLNLLDEGRRRRDFLGLAVFTSLAFLSHPMMGSIFVVSLGLLAAAYSILAWPSPKGFLHVVLGLGAGVLLAGWWLLPSLRGTITELDASALAQAAAFAPDSTAQSLNPLARIQGGTYFYAGASLFVAAGLASLLWRRLSPLTRSLLVAGMVTGLISLNVAPQIYRLLPFYQLLWPQRFMPFAGLVLLLLVLFMARDLLRQSGAYRYLAVGLLALLFIDFVPSLQLVRLGEAPQAVVTAAEELRGGQGWRVATVDLGNLGSPPSFFFTAVAGREQVYGFGYQGASTARTVSTIDYAVERGFYEYAVDRLNKFGADDVVLADNPNIGSEFHDTLLAHGYTLVSLPSGLSLYHRNGAPRAYILPRDVLVIGRGAPNVAYMFPAVMVGSSSNIEDYELDFLSRFRTLFLSHFQWRSRGGAEELVRQYVARGGNVIIDASGIPKDPVSSLPKMFGVYSESLPIRAPIVAETYGSRTALLPFSDQYDPWVAHTPQGLDATLVRFDYLGEEAALLGTKDVGPGDVWFVGLNLPYHAALTGDQAAVDLLEGLLGVAANDAPDLSEIALLEYQASTEGYTFVYELAQGADAGGEEVLIPVAYRDGTVVEVDGEQLSVSSVDNLIVVTLPAGRHQVRISFQETAIYGWGLTVSVLGTLVLMAYLVRVPWLEQWGRYVRHETA